MDEVVLLRTTTATVAVALAVYVYIKIQKYKMRRFVLRSGGIADQKLFFKGRGAVVGT